LLYVASTEPTNNNSIEDQLIEREQKKKMQSEHSTN
jgi:hypothetical protein